MAAFDRRKQQILDQLSIPTETYTDASPKGSIDNGISELVKEINLLDGLVTTSSCSGRIAVYQEGHQTSVFAGGERAQLSAPTGKGGGKWLFVSHDPVRLDLSEGEGVLYKLLSLPPPAEKNALSPVGDSRFVHFKFEPMILHVLCSSLDIARKILAAAFSAGFRESGISSINDNLDLILVGVRSSGLAFDSIVAHVDPDESITTMVTAAYLKSLIDISNQRFQVNSSRKERFRAALRAAFNKQSDEKRPYWEPSDVRRERKRAEGMQRRNELKAVHERDMSSVSDDFEFPFD